MKYNAFISYSHAIDGKLAPALQRVLHRIARPWHKRKVLNIFRDETELSATPHLWDTIEKALSQSEYLILLASPEAAKSMWVKKEVDYWLKKKSINNLLIGVTEGVLIWDNDLNDFNWEKTNALPDNLKKQFRQEPLFVDFREINTNLDLSIDNPEFKKKSVLLAATLHGKTVSDLVGEDIIQQKRTIRLRNAVITILTIMFLLSSFATWWALKSQEEAQIQREEALIQRDSANYQKQISIQAQKETEIQKKEAENQRDSANYQRQVAFDALAEAEIQRDFANYQRQIALKAQREAEVQRDSARLERDISESNRLASIANNLKAENPSLALRVAEKAYEKVYPPVVNASLALSSAYFEFFDNKISPYNEAVNLEGTDNFTFFDDGSRILSASSKKTFLYKVKSKEEIKLVDAKHNFFIFKKAKIIITYFTDSRSHEQQKEIKLWNYDGKFIRELSLGNKEISNIYFIPQKNKILLLSRDKNLYLYDLQSKSEIKFIASINSIHNLCEESYQPDCYCSEAGQYFFTQKNNNLSIWNHLGQKIKTIKSSRLLDASPNEDKVVVQNNKHFEVHGINNSSNAVLENSIVLGSDYWVVKFSTNGKYIISTLSSHERILDSPSTWLSVKVWNLKGELVQNLHYDIAIAQKAITSANDKFLLVQTANGFSRKDGYAPWDNNYSAIWDIANDKLIKKVSTFNSRYDDPKPKFLEKNQLIFLASAKRLEILDFVDDLTINSLTHDRPIKWFYIDDERRIIKTGDAENIKIWNFEGELLLHILGKKGTQISYASSGDFILSQEKIWKFNKKIAKEYNHGEKIEGVIKSSDGKRILTYSRSYIKVWDLNNNLVANVLPNVKTEESRSSYIKSVVFIPNSHRFIAVGNDSKISLYNADGSFVKKHGFDTYYGIEKILFSKDGEWFFTINSLGAAVIWNTKVFNFLAACKINSAINTIQFPDSEVCLIGTTLFKSMALPFDTIELSSNFPLWHSIGFLPEKELFASPDRERVDIYTYEGTLIKNYYFPKRNIIGALFTTSKDKLLTYSQKYIQLTNLDTGEMYWEIDASKYKGINKIHLTSNGYIYALTESESFPMVIWNNKGELLNESNSHKGFIKHFVHSPNGNTFITSSGRRPSNDEYDMLYSNDIDYTMKMWSEEGNIIASFDKSEAAVTAIGFLDNGKQIYVASEDGKLRIFPTPKHINKWIKKNNSIPVLRREELKRLGIE